MPHPHARRGTQGLWSPARASPPLGVHSKPPTQRHRHQGWPRPQGAHTGTPRPRGSGDGDPGGASLLVPKDPSQKRTQHADGDLGKVTRLLDSGGGGSPSSEPILLPERRDRFREGAGEPGTPHGWGDRSLPPCCCCCCVSSVVSNSVRPHRWQPTRLPRTWDSPGKITGEGCHFLPQCRKVKSESEVTQSCPTRSDPMDCSPPGSSVHGIFQARVLELGTMAFSGLEP